MASTLAVVCAGRRPDAEAEGTQGPAPQARITLRAPHRRKGPLSCMRHRRATPPPDRRLTSPVPHLGCAAAARPHAYARQATKNMFLSRALQKILSERETRRPQHQALRTACEGALGVLCGGWGQGMGNGAVQGRGMELGRAPGGCSCTDSSPQSSAESINKEIKSEGGAVPASDG